MPNDPDRKYVRVYYSIQDDPKFDRVRGSVATLGTWLRLLMAADAVWPASADFPRALSAPHIRLLVEVGLVDQLPEHRFRIHGLDAERSARSNAASNAAAVRWHGKGNAEVMPSKAEQSKRLTEDVDSLNGPPKSIGARPWIVGKPTGTDDR